MAKTTGESGRKVSGSEWDDMCSTISLADISARVVLCKCLAVTPQQGHGCQEDAAGCQRQQNDGMAVGSLGGWRRSGGIVAALGAALCGRRSSSCKRKCCCEQKREGEAAFHRRPIGRRPAGRRGRARRVPWHA